MIEAPESQLKEEAQKRSQAYNSVFVKNSPYVQDVLNDLAKFCRANETTFHADARLHAVLEGRREVWLRIQEHLQLNHEELYEHHVVRQNKKQTRTSR